LSERYFQEAVDAYRASISRNDNAAQAYYRLGVLYYGRGAFNEARDAFVASGAEEARKFVPLCLYALGEYAQALKFFDEYDCDDDEYRYVHGLTAEKLNLYERALKQYAVITAGPWVDKARARIDAIDRREGGGDIARLDPALASRIDAAPGQEAYPQAGALVLSCDEHIEITPEATEISTLRYTVKILNERGKESFAETAISYDSTFERVEVLWARTIKPDGAVVDVGSRHIRDVSKYMNFPLYSNARARIISFPEVVDGAVIDYAVKVHNNELIDKKHFVIGYPLQSSEPILDARFTVSAPLDRTIRFKNLNAHYNTFASLDPLREEKDGMQIYRWQWKNIPQVIPEPQMPPDCEINPTILLSSFASWEEIYAWWWNLARDKMAADDAICAQVRELIAQAKGPEEKARAIYEFCARDIRYVAVEYGQAGYEPHHAADILRNKYGDCKDQAILLVTMLAEAGIEAWPVLIATRDYYDLDPEFPSMLFNHCIAAAEIGGTTVYMDPTAETCSFGDLPAQDQGRKVLMCMRDGYRIESIPMLPASGNVARQSMSIALGSDESVQGTKTVETTGVYDQAQRYWLLYTQPEIIEQVLQGKVQEITVGGKLLSWKVKHLDDLRVPIVLRYEFRGPEYLTAAGDLRLCPRLAFFDAALAAQDTRRYPLSFSALDTKENVFHIDLPPGFSVRYIPADVREDNEWFSFSVDYVRAGQGLSCRQVFSLKRADVPVTAYPDFKRACERLAREVKQSVVLEKKR
jgi:tetratricopeptide (TPR) repeat protein